MEPDYDYASAIQDEIALEGLDGITLQALWLRLDTRPNFHIRIDEKSKVFIWDMLKHFPEVHYYELPTPREALVIYNRFDHYDPEVGSVVERDELIPADIYPHKSIDDEATGNRGSCSTYHERQQIDAEAKKLTLAEAEKLENRLILVASQRVRYRALTGMYCDPSLELGPMQYCMLERIGRARYPGEVTQGKHSLQVLGEDAKTLHYYRKILLKHKLINKQPFHVRNQTQSFTSCGTLLHLPRFYVERRPKSQVFLEQVFNYLKKKPLYAAEYDEIRQVLGVSVSVKKILQSTEFQKYIATDIRLPYRSLYPNATTEEWKHKGSNREKMVRVMQLTLPHVDIKEALSQRDDTDLFDDEDTTSQGILEQSNLVLNRPILQQAYYMVEDAGPEGCTQQELGKLMGQPKLEARSLCRNLDRKGLVYSHMRDEGRQRVCRFISRKYEKESEQSRKFTEEKERLLELMGETNASEKPSADDVAATEETAPSDVRGEDVSSDADIEVQVKCFNPAEDSETKSSFIEDLKSSTTHVSTRFLRRMNMVIEEVRESKVISDVSKLCKLISDKEAKEGYETKIDKKTLMRILYKLDAGGHVKNMQAILKCKDKEKVHNFVCDPSITAEHSLIQSVIEQAKLKFFMVGSEVMRKMRASMKDAAANPFVTDSVDQSVQEMKDMDPVSKVVQGLVPSKKMRQVYGYVPKFHRMREMHTFLFYLIYGYEGNPNLDQKDTAKKLLESSGHDSPSTLENELFQIYVPEVSWKTFVPPLPVHKGWPKGWCLICDILLRLPLSIFVKVVHLSYNIPGLLEYLQHPIRKHYLVRNLPTIIRSSLLVERRYMYSVHENVTRLCYLGVVQFGPQKQKEKDQVFVYLNRKSALLDTTSSPPAYHKIAEGIEYPRLDYTFETLQDVECYWYDMWNIAMQTQLGSRLHTSGKNITFEFLPHKTAMQESTRPRQSEEAEKYDDHRIPGDHLGAAGLDSAFFVHLKRNWSWHGQHISLPEVMKDKKQKVEKAKKVVRWASYRSAESNQTIPVPVTVQQNVKRTTKGQKRKVVTNKVNSTVSQGRRAAKKVFNRVVEPRKRVPRKPYYDDVDRGALRLMSKLRVDWSSAEDSLLLLCKVAIIYLVPQKQSKIANCAVVRDILHRNIPESKNKTSRACQRRLLYMMKNPRTMNNVALFLEEVKQDPVVQEKFGQPAEEIKASGLGMEERFAALNHIFTDLVDFLRDKFKVQEEGATYILPDTIEELTAKFTVTFPPTTLKKHRLFRDVKNIFDIHFGVVTSLAYSSLCCIQDKTPRSFQLYKIYQQYSDSLLRSVIARMRADQMISLKKYYMRPHYRQGSYLPLNSTPFQLSITYLHLMQNKFQYQIFSESYQMLKKLQEHHEKQENEGMEVVINSEGGAMATIVELMISDQIQFHTEVPEQVIVLDPKIKDVDEPYVRILERYKEIIRSAQGNKDIPTTSAVFRDLKSIDAEDEMEEEEPKMLAGKGGKRKMVSLKGEPQKKRKVESTEGTSLPSNMDCSTTDIGGEKPTDIVFEEDKKSCSTASESSQHNLVARAASRIALYMMREEMRESPTDLTQHAHDFFMVNSCRVSCSLQSLAAGSESAGDGQFSFYLSKDKVQEILEKLKFSSVYIYPSKEAVQNLCQDSGFTDQQVNTLTELLTFIKSKKELGATAKDLLDYFGNVKSEKLLEEYVTFITEKKVVIRSGITVFRFVAYPFVRPWLIHSFKLNRLQKEKMAVPPEKTLYHTRQDDEEMDSREQVEEGNPSTETVKETDKEAASEIHCEGIPKCTKKPGEVVTIDKKAKRNRTKGLPEQMANMFEDVNWNESEQVNVPIRPWIRVDGTVNRRVLDRFLGSILTYLMQWPGISLQVLGERFSPGLQPVHTMELVEILQEIKCVYFYTILAKEKPSLFSGLPVHNMVAVESISLKEWETVCVETKADATVRLGQFIGDKLYASDFLTLKDFPERKK